MYIDYWCVYLYTIVYTTWKGVIIVPSQQTVLVNIVNTAWVLILSTNTLLDPFVFCRRSSNLCPSLQSCTNNQWCITPSQSVSDLTTISPSPSHNLQSCTNNQWCTTPASDSATKTSQSSCTLSICDHWSENITYK